VDWLEIAEKSVKEHGAIQKPPELAVLLEFLAERKPATIVEIGADEGGTLWSWSQLPGPPRVIAVDLPSGPFRKASGLPAEHGSELVIGDSHRRETFDRVVELTGGLGTADMLFVDGDHTYRGVWSDYHGWRPLVRPGGLIVFHDIVIHPQFAVGVHFLWEEIRDLWPSREIISVEGGEWGGIGVLVNEPLPVPEPVRVIAR
jgi:predicted O-methyltransferase YrrM